MDSRVIEIRKHLKKKLDPMRFEHTLGVSYTCQALAMRYGYDLDKAELAGLLHDCAKRYDRPTMLEKCISRGSLFLKAKNGIHPCFMQNWERGWPGKNTE